jgi:peroxiredoxin
MKHLFLTLVFAAAVLGLGACAAEKNSPNPPLAVGSKVENFKLGDTGGAEKALDELKGTNGTVIVFVSAQCPFVKQYNARISRFATDFAAKGINVVGINSNYTESPDWAKSHAAENYKFPVLLDKGNVIADKLGASSTPEIYFLNAQNTLVYHGGIDNSSSGENITQNYLRDAVDQTLSGQPVVKSTAKAVGCSIKRV